MHTASPTTAVAEYPRQPDRRHRSRTPTIFTMRYSGMELAFFVDIPGVEEPLCIAQSRVSWIEGRRFGVELGAMRLEDMNHLGFFLWNHNSPSNNQDGSN